MIVAAGSVLPAAASAQAVIDIRPSVTISELYDSNLFATPDAPHADFITRFTPAIETAYRTDALDLGAVYTLDAERYATADALSRLDARQHAGIDARYEMTPRVSWSANAAMTRTSTPGELLAQTGVLLPRARATHVSAQAALTRRLDPQTDGTLEYTLTDDRIDDGVRVRTQGGALNATRRLSPRTTARFGYRVESYGFGPARLVGNTSMTAHAIGVGWTYALRRRTSLSVAAGPRLTGTQLAPEISTTLRSTTGGVTCSLGYQRTQSAVLGVARPVAIDSVTTEVQWGAPGGASLRIAPAWFRNRADANEVQVYRMDVAFVYPLVETLAVEASAGGSSQSGRFQQSLTDGAIDRYTSSIRLIYRPAAIRGR